MTMVAVPARPKETLKEIAPPFFALFPLNVELTTLRLAVPLFSMLIAPPS